MNNLICGVMAYVIVLVIVVTAGIHLSALTVLWVVLAIVLTKMAAALDAASLDLQTFAIFMI